MNYRTHNVNDNQRITAARMRTLMPVALMAATLAIGPTFAREMTKTCRFEGGPRAGESQRFPQATAIPVGYPCQDGRGSYGTSISEDRRSSDRRSSERRSSDRYSSDSSSGESRTCEYTSGPKAGETEYFPQAQAVRVGSSCWDGRSSHGRAVPDEDADSDDRRERSDRRSGSGSSGMSKTCEFTSGPKAGETQHFPSAQAVRVGSRCWDGVSSHGTAVADDED